MNTLIFPYLHPFLHPSIHPCIHLFISALTHHPFPISLFHSFIHLSIQSFSILSSGRRFVRMVKTSRLTHTQIWPSLDTARDHHSDTDQRQASVLHSGAR